MLREHGGFGASQVTRGRQQCDRTPLVKIDELRDRGGRVLAPELCEIARAELGEAFGTVPVEPAQFSTRRQVLAPLVEVRSVLAQAAWPQPINQHPHTIASNGRIVRALDRDLV